VYPTLKVFINPTIMHPGCDGAVPLIPISQLTGALMEAAVLVTGSPAPLRRRIHSV
jgi:hypothetical protein